MEDIRSRLHQVSSDSASLMGLEISGERMATANYVMDKDNISVVTWDMLKEVAEKDTVMVKLMEVVM